MNNPSQNKTPLHKKIRFVMLTSIVFLSTTLFAQYDRQTIDSLEMILHTPTVSDEELFHACKELADIYLYSDAEKSLEFTRQGIHWAEKKKNDYYIAQFYYYAGSAHYYANRLDSTLYCFEQSLARLKQADNKHADNQADLDVLQMNLFESMGVIHRVKGNYDLALEHYYAALDRAEKIHNMKETASICVNIAITYAVLSNVRQAETYYRKSEQLYRELNDSIGLADAYQGLSNISISQEDYPKALEYAEEANRIISALPDASVYQLMEATQLLTDIWIRIPNYEKALEFAVMTVEYARQSNNSVRMATSLYMLSHCYLKQERYSEAEETAFQALRADTTDIYINSILYMIITESNIYLKNSDKAIEYFSKTMDAIRAYSNQNYQSSISEMEVKYETEKKESQITVLQEERRLMIWLSIAGGVVLLLGLAALFFLWRWAVQKRRVAEQLRKIAVQQHELTEQQRRLAETRVQQLEQEKQLIATQAVLDGEVRERSRLARDLHDGLGSLLTCVKLNLESLKGNTTFDTGETKYYDNAMQILDDSMREMRRVAHHLMPAALNRYGLKAALTDFCATLPSVEFAWYGNDNRLDDRKLEVMIYQIIHELINNALKHAGATAIGVNVMRETDYIAFTVFDNGCGFDTSSEHKGMGLRNIRERIASFGGRIEVASQAGKGTEVNGELKV